ncbi:plus-3-domain-containing protein [Dichomitus squalens LYAD-421 SS1]|uniref:Plus-3-domain-containing protein n=1 Tax=Dichomitus squalens (strain LYAD-421) TaxID=732165 RepID=R7SKQ9_DICSQ|nr:plus-3-domain-containing protein [Dichomitus squalens LYAD-421 SS1]EJF56704.1 plus-3-domain-containing protein [Dichomitus squalens LYAD-421 SS1]
MSDSEGDIDDELLELAGATEKKRKRSQQNPPPKRRKADTNDETESEAGQPESEEETESNPYPLEGKFIDEEDRNRLMDMPEIEREEVLAQRQEELQRFADKRQLDQMLKLRSGAGGGEDAVSKAAKRQHAIRGATKEKTRKLDELKAKRKAKDEKKRTRTNSPKRDRSSSPMDMDMSDEEEEDGQITKYDEEEERDRKLFGKVAPEEELSITLEDLEKCRVTRNQIAKYCMAPWFGEYIKGAWVRYLIGEENKQPVYRICEVVDLPEATVKPYKVNDQLVNQELELKHGGSTRRFAMDKISNGPFEEKEFERLQKTCETEKVKLPMRRQLEKKTAQLQKLANQPMTESDIAAILQRKRDINVSVNKSSTSLTMERSRLQQARTLAIRRQDFAEVAQIDAKLAELQANAPVRGREEEGSSDILAKLNERNRRLNQEQVRKAERAEMERRRREKLARAGSGATTPTPNANGAPSGAALDAAARLKAKMLGGGTSRSVPGTPGTPAVSGSTPRSLSPAAPPPGTGNAPKSNGNMSFEASLLQSVEIDLGDF